MSTVFLNNKKYFANVFVFKLACFGFFVPLSIFSRLDGDVTLTFILTYILGTHNY